MKTWLKGGLIGAGIVFTFILILYLYSHIAVFRFYGAFFMIGGFIVGSVIGAIISYIIKSEGPNSLKGLKIGFWIGLIFAILLWIAAPLWRFLAYYDDYDDFWRALLTPAPGEIIIPLGILIGGLLIGWIAGKIKSQ